MGAKRKPAKILRTINVTPEIHKRLALLAIHRGETIGMVVAELLASAMPQRAMRPTKP